MESSSVERKVGLFVVIGVVGLIVLIFVLGGDRALFRSFQNMQIVLDETSGLTSGGVVQIAGVPAGNVTGMVFNDEGRLTVFIKVDKRFVKKITKGSTASLRTQGALGDKFVLIKPGPMNAPVMGEGETIPAEESGDFMSTLGKSGSYIEKSYEIIERLNKLMKDLDDGRFAKNLTDSSRSLKGSMTNLDEALSSKKLNKAIIHMASIMEKIDNGQGTLGGLINDPTIHEDLKSILGGAKRSNLLKYLIRQTIQKSEDEQEQPKKK